MAYLIIYGALPSAKELARWDEALMRHSAVPVAVERAVAALPHDAHFMGIVLTALNALSTVHPEQNPALAGQNVYDSREIQDKQIVRIIGAALQRDEARPALRAGLLDCSILLCHVVVRVCQAAVHLCNNRQHAHACCIAPV